LAKSQVAVENAILQASVASVDTDTRFPYVSCSFRAGSPETLNYHFTFGRNRERQVKL